MKKYMMAGKPIVASRVDAIPNIMSSMEIFKRKNKD